MSLTINLFYRTIVIKMRRMWFAIIQGFRHRQALSQIRSHGHGNIYNLDLQTLKDHGIHVLVFDFDGVLSGHGEGIPNPKTLSILKHSMDLFGKQHIFILSNKPLKSRELYFKENFPEITFVYAKRKKPYPDGLQQIIEITQADPKTIALIDDRLLTGGLATCLAGTQMIYIDQPLQNFHHQFFAECFFHGLRTLEKWVLK